MSVRLRGRECRNEGFGLVLGLIEQVNDRLVSPVLKNADHMRMDRWRMLGVWAFVGREAMGHKFELRKRNKANLVERSIPNHKLPY
uniref:Uncharacterized protein n=1 Tax=Nelumbo nucifera TaxID=4432 RepID=A0A822ZUE5_NELNU|nr:TPA_asm: hypothetical protein HUJ06_003748 [Nelumbo nucifera]